MVFFRTLLFGHHHGFLKRRRPPALPLPRSASLLAAPEIPAQAAAAPIPKGGESTELAAKPRSLYSIFTKPSVVPPAWKPPAFCVSSGRKEEKRKGLPSSKPSRYRPMEEKEFPEVLPPEAEMLVSRLREEGYLKDAKFPRSGAPEPHRIPATLYSRHFLKSAAEKFGRNHQEIAKVNMSSTTYVHSTCPCGACFCKIMASRTSKNPGRLFYTCSLPEKGLLVCWIQEVDAVPRFRSADSYGWLSGSDLKKVALFGCPSVERDTVFAAKRLRSFFRIQEEIICRGCKLKSSCKFMNQKVNSGDKVILADVMRLITLIALDSVPRQLLVPDDLKLSVGNLLKEAVNLSK